MNISSLLSRLFSKPADPHSEAAPPLGQEGPVDEAVIRLWLAGKVAGVLGVTPEEVDPATTFTDYGLDSMQAVRLSGDIETWLGRELSPLLLYDYPSIASLAGYLAENRSGAGANTNANDLNDSTSS